MIVIVDYGMGNLRSIQSKLQLVKIQARVSGAPQDIEAAEKLILPGVGNFATGIRNLRASGLIPVLERQVIERKTPILGICLGMQLFTRRSEEGDESGLGWIPADTRRFDFSEQASRLRVPHVGWNSVEVKKPGSPLFREIPAGKRFYFTHSYHVVCDTPDVVLATSDYGGEFSCAVERGNIYGTQFHPEKSHQSGLKLVENFVRYA